MQQYFSTTSLNFRLSSQLLNSEWERGDWRLLVHLISFFFKKKSTKFLKTLFFFFFTEEWEWNWAYNKAILSNPLLYHGIKNTFDCTIAPWPYNKTGTGKNIKTKIKSYNINNVPWHRAPLCCRWVYKQNSVHFTWHKTKSTNLTTL